MYAGKTIIQIGAHIGNTDNDPLFAHVTESTRLVLVEPVPYLFNQLKDNYTKKMADLSNIIFINKAASDFIGEIEMTVPSERNNFGMLPCWASQLSSVDALHALRHLPHMMVDKIKVATTTIDEIIQQNNIKHIDMLHTDTEGHDYTILMGYSFAIKPSVIQFEHKHMDGFLCVGEKYNTLVSRLTAMGYKQTHQNTEDTTFELEILPA